MFGGLLCTLLREHSMVLTRGAASGNTGGIWDDEPEQSTAGIIELAKDAEIGHGILMKAINADWWNWAGGSTHIFWQWLQGFQRTCARDGMPP
jgi:hypothetical protein